MPQPEFPRLSPRMLKRGAVVAAVVLLLLGLPTAAHLYVDLRWFRSLGFEPIFTTILWTRILLGLSVGLLAAALLFANLRLALRLSEGLKGFVFSDPTGTTRLEIGPIAKRIILPAVLLVGAFVGVAAADHWDTWLRWVHASEFGTNDPIFGWDAGFYLFELPALETATSLAVTLLGLCLATCAALYFTRGALTLVGRGVKAHGPARSHLSIIGAFLLLGLAAQAWLAIPNLMYSELGPVQGASFADVNARLLALQGQIAITAIAAVLVAISATRKRMVLAIVGVALYAASELLGVRLYPALVHQFDVVPNEALKEAPYIQHNIEATRLAYGLDRVAERELTGEVTLTRADIDDNQATIHNIRLWDHDQLLATFAQIQEIRTYYEFANVDNDRYMIDGDLRQTMLSARELESDHLPNRRWITERFTYTHGYGITLGPVNTATPEGLPELFVKDIPPISQLPDFQVTRPELYFGELSTDHVFVKTANPEFDYPAAEDVYADYEGTGGIPLDSFAMIAAAALHLGSYQLLLSDDVNDQSRLLLNRRIRDRVRRIAPFLRFDQDPYMVLRDDGSLVWILDAYTTSRRYPYSQATDDPRLGRINYIRNSVKAVIDAYHGSVDLYVADARDPVLRTWRRIFPGAFRPMSEMPSDVRAHLRYPEDIFRVQTQIFTKYHMAEATLLYNREDQWEIPAMRRGDASQQAMVPYYTVMRLPGEEAAEFIQMIPFTPMRKQNLAAWMVARMDGDHLGELVVYRFPKDRLVFGPQQVMNRIDQEEEISRQISLWDQRGSEAILGTLLVIPIEEALIYVVPLYLRAQGGEIPELKRVIVVYENQIAMEATLDAAVETLFGPPSGEAQAAAVPGEGESAEPPGEEPGGDTAEAPAPGTPEVPPAADHAERAALGARARAHYERAIAAQREGDWATYGQEIEQLGALLQQLAAPPAD